MSGRAGGAGSGPQTLWNRQGLSSGSGPLPRLTAGRRGVLLEGPGARGGAEQGPGAGVGRGWGKALSLVKAGAEPGLSTGLEGRPGRLQSPGAQAIRGKAWPGHPRIQSLTHRTQQEVGVTWAYPEQDTTQSGWHQTLSCWSAGTAVWLRKGVGDGSRHTCPGAHGADFEGRFMWVVWGDPA